MVHHHPGRRLLLASACAAFARTVHAEDAPASAAPPQQAARDGGPGARPAYVFFDQTIDAASMRVLRRTLAGLVGDGVQQVTLVLSSSGGAIDPTLLTYSFIRSLPVRVDTHAAGFVQSSATALFLAGEGRTADRTARFMFHPWTVTQPAEASEQGVRESLARIEAVTEVELSILRDRTGLPEETLQRFRRGTVFLTAEQAREAGVVHAVADLRIPGGSQARIITLG